MDKNFLKEHAVYQIYPISFQDSNGDGKGDIQGIISKLDYLDDLGIKILWLSPIYPSPMFDMGYDISNYKDINPIFGTMKDFDELIQECEKRGMKIVMDLVVNHTSDEHPWFQEALKDKNSPYRDYYIFKEGKKKKDGSYDYPNNWTSNFTGPAWSPVPNEEGMFYLHIFTKKQPDLNWYNEKVLQEVEDIITFWIDKGVYGFRCDVISEIYKTTFEDGKKSISPFSPVGAEHYVAQKGNHEILKRIRKDVIEPRGAVLIGECGGEITPEQGQEYLDNELDTFFEFEMANLSKSLFEGRIKPAPFKECIIRWQKTVDWNGNYLENHDQHRVYGRYVYGKNELMGGKMLLMLQYTLRGTPFIYMGQEFAAHDYDPPLEMEECTDCVTKAILEIAKGYHLPKPLAKKVAFRFGRDNERAPMAFEDKEGYGFSQEGVKPWQRYNGNSKIYNAKTQKDFIEFFKTINRFREEHKVLTYGNIQFDAFQDAPNDVLVFTREWKEEKMLVVLNLSDSERVIPNSVKVLEKKLLLSNREEADKLLPYQGLIYSL